MKSVLLSAIIALSPVAFAADKLQAIELLVTEKGFEPETIDVKPGSTVVLNVTRKTDATCAKAIKIPSKNVKKDLPLNKTVNIELGKLDKGEIRFACGMDMLSGKIIVR